MVWILISRLLHHLTTNRANRYLYLKTILTCYLSIQDLKYHSYGPGSSHSNRLNHRAKQVMFMEVALRNDPYTDIPSQIYRNSGTNISKIYQWHQHYWFVSITLHSDEEASLKVSISHYFSKFQQLSDLFHITPFTIANTVLYFQITVLTSINTNILWYLNNNFFRWLVPIEKSKLFSSNIAVLYDSTR